MFMLKPEPEKISIYLLQGEFFKPELTITEANKKITIYLKKQF